jgi:glutamate transport system ATP-binding protein
MSTERVAASPVEIEVRGVSKWFGQHQVLKKVSMEVRRGEAVVVIGPSGSGTISIGGRPMGYTVAADGTRRRQSERDIAAMRAQVGMVFQSFNLFPHMSVLRNVALGPIRVRGMKREEAEAIGRRLLERVGLGEKIDAFPGQLSGGQQQRVAIARALAMEPKAMLFDEVTSALDPELVGEVLDVMRQLMQDGMTMVIVTHEMAFARSFAGKVVFMADGEIIESGNPEQIFEVPNSPRLQAFLKRFRQGYRI